MIGAMIFRLPVALFITSFTLWGAIAEAEAQTDSTRPPASESDLKFWLQNMVWHHQFTHDEIHQVTGLSNEAIDAALKKFKIGAASKPKRGADEPLLVLPYPGGRHPRIGFLDGAIRPQRETKFSVFTPWDDSSYAVIDVPEAIWSNLGLTYLAHTHVDTVWTKQKIDLPKMEWKRLPGGVLEFQRKLPNGIVFGSRVKPGKDAVRMEMWLKNGTDKPLSDLRVQNCVMLKGAKGFNAQTGDNKRVENPYVLCQSDKRWIITAWDPCHRPWINPPVPCLHSDPKFPDCPPGETRRINGWFSFYEGEDIAAELKRIEATGWREKNADAAE